MKKILFLLSLLIFIRPLSATTRYVAKTGNDSNTCAQSTSTSTPKLTITSGLSCMSAGDELQVRDGTYVENIAITNLGGTSWENQITVRNYPGESPIIRPSGGTRLLYFQGVNTHYITFDGFVFDAVNTTLDAIKVTCGSCTGSDSAHHVRIKNSEIKNSQLCGVLTSTGSDYVELSNLNVHDNGLSNVCHGVYIHSSYGILENSLLHDNKKLGAQFYSDTGGVNYGIIRNNKFYNNGIGGLGSGAGHLAVGSGTGHLVYNNILYASTVSVDGIKISYGGSGIGVYNNTIYGLGYKGITIESATNTIVRNNIASSNSTNIYNSGTNTIFSNNLCSADGTGCNSSLTESAASTFVTPESDFHLKPGSHAIETGYDLSAIFTTDYDGISRPLGSAFDIGAYERRPIFYVAKSGSNSNPCTADSEANAKLTIAAGLGCLSPGSILQVHSGTYVERFVANIPSGTSEGARITLQAYPSETVIIRPGAGNRIIEMEGSQKYITIDGFDLDASNCSYDAIKIFSGTVGGTVHDPHHIKITNCLIHNWTTEQGILIAAIGPSVATGTDEISNNTIYSGGGTNSLFNAIYYQVPNGTISGNTIYDVAGAGIQVYSGYAGGAPNNVVIKNNKVYNSRSNTLNKGQGIITSSGNNMKVYNNIVYGLVGNAGGSGGLLIYSGLNHGVYNNTVYGCQGPGITVSSTNPIIRNNISSANGDNMFVDGGTGITWSNNLCNDNEPTGCAIKENVNSTFNNPSGANFTLKSNSQAINGGYSLSGIVDTDYIGTARPQGSVWDIGAYEYTTPPDSITLQNPNGGGSVQVGQTLSITWTTVGSVADIKLRLSRDGGSSWETIIASTPNDGVHDWVVTGATSTQCRVEASDVATGLLVDISDSNFTIASSVTPTITVTSPVTGQICPKGSDVVIGWNSQDVTGNVTIKLSRNNGVTWETIVESTAYNSPDVTYTATIPSSSNCIIRVISLNDSNVYGTSGIFRLGGSLSFILR